jgi:hypothetical protein
MADDAVTPDMCRVTARQRLHRLLIDAHDDGVLGRVPVEATDSCDFSSEVWVRGMEPGPDAMRAQASGAQDASDRAPADALAATRVQSIGDGLVGPHIAKGHAAIRRSLAGQRDDLAPDLQRHTRGPPAPRRIEQRLDARASLPSGAPLAHDASAAPDEPRHLRRTIPVGEPYDDPRANDDVVLSVPTPGECLHATPFLARDAHGSRSRTRHVHPIHEGRLSFHQPQGTRLELLAGRTRAPS